MDTEFDYIVIGAGINGAWSGYHLAKLGHKTLIIEQVSKQVRIFFWFATQRPSHMNDG